MPITFAPLTQNLLRAMVVLRIERGQGLGQIVESFRFALGLRCRACFLRNRLTDKGHGEGHHDGCSEALRRPGGNQQPQCGRNATQG